MFWIPLPGSFMVVLSVKIFLLTSHQNKTCQNVRCTCSCLTAVMTAIIMHQMWSLLGTAVDAAIGLLYCDCPSSIGTIKLKKNKNKNLHSE